MAKQRANHKQPHRAIGDPSLKAAQMNLHGIKGRNTSGAECDNCKEELASRNGECHKDKTDQYNRDPAFCGKCE
jgi:hypothetical protein